MYELHVCGGLGDFFCFMLSPLWKGHPLRGLKTCLVGREHVDLYIYSDNPDSASIFENTIGNSLTILRRKHHEFHGQFSNIPTSYCTDDSMGFYNFEPVTHSRSSIIVHPFTTTQSKEWLRMDNNLHVFTELLRELSEGNDIFILGRDTPELYFGGEASFSCKEHIDINIPNVYTYVNKGSSLVHDALALMCNADKMLCIDSAYMMARWVNSRMKVISLFPDSYKTNDKLFDHYFYQGLDKAPNEYLYYKDITVESLLRKTQGE